VFTGLVSGIGTIERVGDSAAGRELRVRCPWNDLAAGESVAVNGVCVTVRERGDGWFTCAAVTTTVDATTVGAWKPGRAVNLERAMRADDRFGGHIVQGHVDGVARVVRVQPNGDELLVDLALPAGLPELMVQRGSVAVDGVSLTIAGLPAPDMIRLSIIDFTRRRTTFSDINEGDAVNVEADVIAKHVHQMLAPHRT